MMDADDLAYISKFALERGKDDVGVVMQINCPDEVYEAFLPLDAIIASGVECFLNAGAEYTEGKHPIEDVRIRIIWAEART